MESRRICSATVPRNVPLRTSPAIPAAQAKEPLCKPFYGGNVVRETAKCELEKEQRAQGVFITVRRWLVCVCKHIRVRVCDV